MAASGETDLDPEVLKSLVAEAVEEDLEPLAPDKALEMYERIREDEITESTLKTHRSRLQFFIQWCDQRGITDMNDLNGRDLQEFRSWRKQALAPPSLESNMLTFRVFLRKCVKFDAVRSDLPEKVEVPVAEDDAREEFVSADRAAVILDHLDKYQYGTTEHVAWVLLTAAGLRLSTVHALDVSDYTSTSDGGSLDINHRPESETPLKNKAESERTIHLSEYASNVIDDYLADQRPNTVDDYGRFPLLASDHGRLVKTAIRKYVYKWTRPCAVTGSCPHGFADDEIDECDAAQAADTACKCPSSSSPHTLRRGYITHELNAGVPDAVVSDRCDVSPGVIDEHYDERTETERMQLRKEIRESTYGEEGDSGYGQ